MRDPKLEPHPLDDDDDENAVSRKPVSGVEHAYQPLLRRSVQAVLASFVVLFVAGVAANIAVPNSRMESIASIAHRLGMIAMLIAFSSMLIAYRIPQLKRKNFQMLRNPGIGRGFTTLVALNFLGVFVALGIAFFLSVLVGPVAFGVIAILSAVYAGLLATMAIWHSGYLRAYAVGALTVLLINANSGMASYMVWAIGPLRGTNAWSAWPIALQLPLAPLTGVVCAAYVCLLDHMRKQQEDDSSH